MPDQASTSPSRFAVGLWSAIMATIIIGPMATKGWVVLLDWVSGPRVDFADRIFAGDSLPAGPLFFGAATLLHGVLGAAGGWLLPWVALFVAGVGASRLTPGPLVARLTAMTAFVWNPFVHERLYAGQMAVLLGYAALPFVFHYARTSAASSNVRPATSCPGSPCTGFVASRDRANVSGRGTSGRSGWLATAGCWAVAAAVSIHYAVLGGLIVASAGIAVAVTTRRFPWRWMGAVFAVTAVVTASWLLPIVSHAPDLGDERTVRVFATRPDPAIGLLGGVAAQRGFWRPSLGEPGSDRGWWWPIGAGALGGAALLGLHAHWKRGRRALVISVGMLGVLGWLFGQGLDGWAGPIYRALLEVPGLGVMREAGKFIALVPLAWSVGLAGCAEALADVTPLGWVRVRRAVLAVALVPAVLSPGLAWAVGGRLAAVRYPPAWKSFRAIIAVQPDDRVVVLPWEGYIKPNFTGGRVVKHPAHAFFGEQALVSDDAEVAGLGPSPATRAIADALGAVDGGPRLATLGVVWIIRSVDGQIPPALTGRTFRVVKTAGDWSLYKYTVQQSSIIERLK